jgi:hypothetical protein
MMGIVISADGKTIRFAKVGDKIEKGEKQLFFQQGPNGGFIFHEGEIEKEDEKVEDNL